jgi:PIN domain nuclease of toxin-antitoxin system
VVDAGESLLSAAAQSAITDPANNLYLSSVSAIELSVKVPLGKLTLPLPVDQFIATAMSAVALIELPLTVRHAVALAGLPLHHRDPFDRLLISQALVKGLTLITDDAEIRRYSVARLW